MKRLIVLIVLAFAACGKSSSPSAPTVSTPTTTVPPSTLTLSGRVTESAPTTSKTIPGATLTFSAGANAGKSTTTDPTGNYSLAGLATGTGQIEVSAQGYQPKGFAANITNATTLNFTLPPNAQVIDETFNGTISGGDTACFGGDGTFRDKPCKVITIPIHNTGTIAAALSWTGSADLDLSLFAAGSTNPIARSASATARTEQVSANVPGGQNYELHVTYYGGATIANFSLRVIHIN